jgi:predicted nucleic acid-binding protein
VTAILDTSVIVRYLLNSPRDMAEVSRTIINGNEDLLVTTDAIAEVAYVLGSSTYRVPRASIVDALTEFVQRRNVSLFRLEKGIVLRALEFCRPSRHVSFADAFIWAAARSSGHAVYTFDRRFPSDSIEVRTESA